MNEHITNEAIQRLVNGLASEEESERWLLHMDQCEQCLAIMDQHWAMHLKHGGTPSIPNLESARVHNIEGRILQRIHATEAGKQALRLALVGPLALLKGLFGTSRHNR